MFKPLMWMTVWDESEPKALLTWHLNEPASSLVRFLRVNEENPPKMPTFLFALLLTRLFSWNHWKSNGDDPEISWQERTKLFPSERSIDLIDGANFGNSACKRY